MGRARAAAATAWPGHFLLPIGCLLIATDTFGATVDVEYSHRQVSHGTPQDTTVVEGSVIATFTGDEPITLIGTDPTMIQISPTQYEHTFAWDWPAAKSVSFETAGSETLLVVATPQPVWPFDPSLHTTPVVHVQSDSANLWRADSGLYVWGDHDNFLQTGSEWERPATVDFYDETNTLAWTQDIGLRINGGITRSYNQKGLRLYHDRGVEDHVDYDLFGSSPTLFRRNVLRTSRFPKYITNSPVVMGLFVDLGFMTSRNQLVTVYLNDEYWGFYGMWERLDDEWVEFTHGISDEYVMLKDGEEETGDPQEWWDFLASFGTEPDPTSHGFYERIESDLDLDRYIDWVLLNSFFASTDNGFQNNVVNLRVDGSPWLFVPWDYDDVMDPGNVASDHLRFYAAADSATFTANRPPVGHWTWNAARQEWCTMLNALMQNSVFRFRLHDRATQLLANELSVAALTSRLIAVRDERLPETTFQGGRWGGTNPTWLTNHTNDLISWVTSRHPTFSTQADTFLSDFAAPLELVEFESTPQEGSVRLDWRTRGETGNLGFVLSRSESDTTSFAPIAAWTTHAGLVGAGTTSTPVDYSFVDTGAVAGRTYFYRLAWEDAGGTTDLPWLEPGSPLQDWSDLAINEFGAENDFLVADGFGEFDDWIELYNGGADTLLLDGLHLTDDLANPTKHVMTGGLLLPPGEHVLLWADEQVAQGPTHLGFRLNDEGEEIGLYRPDGVSVIDTFTFDLQIRDKSMGRYPDGTPGFVYSWNPTPGSTNSPPQTQAFLTLNELQPTNASTIQDNAGDFDPWLEIVNPLPIPLPLDGATLTDSPGTPTEWSLPNSTLPAFARTLVWVDAEPGEGSLHASFALTSAGGWIGLYAPDASTVADSTTYPAVGADSAWARIRDLDGEWTTSSIPTPNGVNLADPPVLFINEFLASNDTNLQDETGAFEDWLEIYNPGPNPVPLGGLHLTDDLADPTQWEFPDTTLAAGGYLIVWCDEDPGDGPLHASFKLSAGGEELGLFGASEHALALIDSRVFGPQTTDVSEGRTPDGGGLWSFYPDPTPGASNQGAVGVPDGAGAFLSLSLGAPRPNPFANSTRLQFQVPAEGIAELDVFDVRGSRVALLHRGPLSAGRHEVTWSGLDDQGRAVASGVYWVRLVQGGRTDVKTVLRLR